MIETTPIPTLSDSELEAWFRESGIAATVVDRCPAPCSWCSRSTDEELAAAA